MVWCLTDDRGNSTLTSTLGSIQLMSMKFGMSVSQKKEYFYKYSINSEAMQCKTLA